MNTRCAAEDISSIVLVAEDAHWIKSQAVLNIAKQLNLPLAAFAAFLQIFDGRLRDFVYDFVADNRYQILGKRATCKLMQPEWKDRFLV
jgi:predicted DCC family thiol-disulfide oxidoreductase YuxK